MKRCLLACFVSLLTLPSDDLVAQTFDPVCLWPGPAQFLTDRPSAPDSLTFRVGESVGKVCYSRPRANGRAVIGDLVPYGRLWRTGANEPTLLYLAGATEIAGVTLPAGRYVLLTIPEQDDWTIIFSTSEATAPAEMFTDRVEVGRATVPVTATDEYVEMFTIETAGELGSGELVLKWERTQVRLPFVAR